MLHNCCWAPPLWVTPPLPLACSNSYYSFNHLCLQCGEQVLPNCCWAPPPWITLPPPLACSNSSLLLQLLYSEGKMTSYTVSDSIQNKAKIILISILVFQYFTEFSLVFKDVDHWKLWFCPLKFTYWLAGLGCVWRSPFKMLLMLIYFQFWWFPVLTL